MLDTIKRFFGGAATKAAPEPQNIERTPPRAPHWKPTGMFAVPVVGEDYYRQSIASIAQNPPGNTALTFCTASLVSDFANLHDSNAVAVFIEGQKVGHLARAQAADFRSRLVRAGMPMSPTTCDAVITNGLAIDGKEYSYTIELDVGTEPDAPIPLDPTYRTPTRRNSTPEFKIQPDGTYLVSVFASQTALADLDPKCALDSWTTDHWTSINYYVPNSSGIGLGHRLFAVDKAAHKSMFPEDDADSRVLSVEGRVIHVAMSPAVNQ